MIRFQLLISYIAAVALGGLAGFYPARAPALTLSDVYERVERESLELKAARSSVQGARGGISQARRVPNPEVELTLEDFGRGEVEVTVSQDIGLGGRRSRRVQAARARFAAEEAELQSAMLRLRADALRGFSATVAARQSVSIGDSLVSLAETTVVSIRRRVEAGAAMPLDLIRGEAELEEVRLARRGLELEYLLARRGLALLWGGIGEAEWEPVGDYVRSPELPPLAELIAAADQHPDMRKLDFEIDVLNAELALARAEALPEIGVGAGYSRNSETGEHGALLGASVSLPVFHRNQGTTVEKYHEIDRAEDVRAREQLARHLEVERVRSEIAWLTGKIDVMRESILPKSERVLRESTKHYQEGAVGVLEVLEAQGALLERLLEQTDNLHRRAELAADLIELTGVELRLFE